MRSTSKSTVAKARRLRREMSPRKQFCGHPFARGQGASSFGDSTQSARSFSTSTVPWLVLASRLMAPFMASATIPNGIGVGTRGCSSAGFTSFGLARARCTETSKAFSRTSCRRALKAPPPPCGWAPSPWASPTGRIEGSSGERH